MSAPLCQCGHPKATHFFENTPGVASVAGGPCQATVYTQRHMGMDACRCKCRKFEPKP